MHMGWKHSKACLNCRTRRIKCDLELPACSQCLRVRMTCSGYRNQQSGMFRDESKKIVQKAKAKASNQRNKTLHVSQNQAQTSKDTHGTQHPTFSDSDSDSDCIVTYSPPSLLQKKFLSPPSLDKGIEFFFDNYITFITATNSGRAALPASVAWHFLFTNPAYASACSAAGYAGLSNITREPAHMVSARRQYALSLRSINDTMNDESSLTMSFESSMILTVFEIVNAGSWGVHVQGGAAIWKRMITHDQSPSPRTQLFYVFFIFMKCLIAEDPSPSGMRAWSHQVQKRTSKIDAHAASLAYITSHFVDLYALVKTGKIPDSNVIVYQARALEVAIEAWQQQLPPEWQFTEVFSRNVHAFRNQTHHYNDFWIARMLNNYRWVRILINNLVLFHLPRPSPDRISSLSTISHLSIEICHSVPFFLEAFTIEEGQGSPFPVLAGSFILIFPLAVAGCAVGVGVEIHEWIIEMLEMMGKRKGIASASLLVDKVKELREEWKIYGELDTAEADEAERIFPWVHGHWSQICI